MCEISLAGNSESTLDSGDVSFRFIASLINRLLDILGESSKKMAMTQGSQRNKVVAEVLAGKFLSNTFVPTYNRFPAKYVNQHVDVAKRLTIAHSAI